MAVYTHLEDYIQTLYFNLNIYRPEQLDMHHIAASLGVDIVYKKIPLMLDGEIHLQKSDKENEWMEFGHELCHYLRHHGCQFDMHYLYVELQEWQADNFMYHFCIPTFMLEKIELPKWKSEAIGLIAHTFNVDYEFASNRLERWWGKKKFYLLDDGAQNQIKNNGGETICIVNKSL